MIVQQVTRYTSVFLYTKQKMKHYTIKCYQIPKIYLMKNMQELHTYTQHTSLNKLF